MSHTKKWVQMDEQKITKLAKINLEAPKINWAGRSPIDLVKVGPKKDWYWTIVHEVPGEGEGKGEGEDPALLVFAWDKENTQKLVFYGRMLTVSQDNLPERYRPSFAKNSNSRVIITVKMVKPVEARRTSSGTSRGGATVEVELRALFLDTTQAFDMGRADGVFSQLELLSGFAEPAKKPGTYMFDEL